MRARISLDGKPPEPEVQERYRAFSSVLTVLQKGQIDEAVTQYLDEIEQQNWWIRNPDLSPSKSPAALRVPADMIRGLLAIARHHPMHRARAMDMAKRTGDYLVEASDQAGVPYAPFPYWRGKSGRLGELSEKAAQMLQQCGALDNAIRKDWFVVEAVPEEYLFDTGRVGEALSELYQVTGDARYRAWLDDAATWVSGQPLSANFNYNAFSVAFLAQLYLATGERIHLDHAVEKMQFGVLSGMIDVGSSAGHWIDAHNERLVYRLIMVRSLGELLLTLEQDLVAKIDAAKVQSLHASFEQSFKAVESQMLKKKGISQIGPMLEVYHQIRTSATIDFDVSSVLKSQIMSAANKQIITGNGGVSAETGLYLSDS
ncbi:MAG: hypothetical protein ABJO01_11470 [Parasphingorhabdus sp.]